MEYQLIVIGAGPGGYTAALRAAALGMHTAVVERREVGGTCLNRGCIPTKTLLHASQVYRDAVDGAAMGVHAAEATFDMGEIFAYKRSVSEKLRGGIHGLLKAAKVDLIEGTGTITAPGQVAVAAADGTVYTLRHEMLAAQVVTDSGSVVFHEPGWANVLKPLLALAGLYVIFAAGYIALDRFATLEATGHLDQV